MLGFKELLIIGVIIIIIFGTSKLRNVGSDLGGAIKNFKKAVKEEEGGAAEEDKKKAETEKQSEK